MHKRKHDWSAFVLFTKEQKNYTRIVFQKGVMLKGERRRGHFVSIQIYSLPDLHMRNGPSPCHLHLCALPPFLTILQEKKREKERKRGKVIIYDKHLPCQSWQFYPCLELLQ